MSSREREILSGKYDETTICKNVTTQPSTIKAISYSTANNRPSTINQLREMKQSHHCYISWFCDSRPQYSSIIQSFTTSLASFIKQETLFHLRCILSSLKYTVFLNFLKNLHSRKYYRKFWKNNRSIIQKPTGWFCKHVFFTYWYYYSLLFKSAKYIMFLWGLRRSKFVCCWVIEPFITQNQMM